MKSHQARILSILSCFVLFSSVLVSCTKEDISPTLSADASRSRKSRTTDTTTTTTTPPPTTTSPLYSLAVNWDNRTDANYTYTEAKQDFPNSTYWSAYVSQTHTGQLQTVMAKDTFGPVGGVMSRFDVPDGSEYEVNFDVMFGNDFDFGRSGKVGFGFLIGNGYTGGGPAGDGTGGSARLVWEKNSTGRVYLAPYLYYKDQPNAWGDERGKSYPATGSIQKNTWYNVKIYVKSNTGSNTDGRIRMVINGTTVIDDAIRWTTDDTYRLINRACFENFRGGNDTTYEVTTDGTIYFDNMNWSLLSY